MQEEENVLNKMNNLRKSHNLSPYKYCSYCTEIAREHSQNMANKVVPFSHDGLNDRIEKLKRKAGVNFIKASENVAYSRPDMNPVDAWVKSSGHLKNMLGDFNYCGIGRVQKDKEFYYTGLFMKLKD